jgi:endogenous inhibitor of DNA gyrase (YacG/DUF329 family)
MTHRRQNPPLPTATPDAHGAARRIVSCPQCGGDSVFAPSNPFRPFCSQRCKDIDFGAWADESFRVPEDTDPQSGAQGGEGRLQ